MLAIPCCRQITRTDIISLKERKEEAVFHNDSRHSGDLWSTLRSNGKRAVQGTAVVAALSSKAERRMQEARHQVDRLERRTYDRAPGARGTANEGADGSAAIGQVLKRRHSEPDLLATFHAIGETQQRCSSGFLDGMCVGAPLASSTESQKKLLFSGPPAASDHSQLDA